MVFARPVPIVRSLRPFPVPTPVVTSTRESVMSRHSLGVLAALFLAALPVAAQSRLPAIRTLGPITARSAEPLGAVSTAVPLPDGRVLVNDVLQRRVVMFDSTLSQVSVVADTPAPRRTPTVRGGAVSSATEGIRRSSSTLPPSR